MRCTRRHSRYLNCKRGDVEALWNGDAGVKATFALDAFLSRYRWFLLC